MKTPNAVVELIVEKLKLRGYSQVKGYNKFEYNSTTAKALIILRECGTQARIPYAKIIQAIEAVQDDPTIYQRGPSSLREYNITHINSPIWSLLHLLTLDELTGK